MSLLVVTIVYGGVDCVYVGVDCVAVTEIVLVVVGSAVCVVGVDDILVDDLEDADCVVIRISQNLPEVYDVHNKIKQFLNLCV